jgi:hypothetical protein
LHTAGEISAQLDATLEHVIKEDAAYYFRYIAKAIITREKRDTILQALAKQEETLSNDGVLLRSVGGL